MNLQSSTEVNHMQNLEALAYNSIHHATASLNPIKVTKIDMKHSTSPLAQARSCPGPFSSRSVLALARSYPGPFLTRSILAQGCSRLDGLDQVRARQDSFVPRPVLVWAFLHPGPFFLRQPLFLSASYVLLLFKLPH